MYVYVSVTQSCPSLCNPMDCSTPGSSVHGIIQARILEWVDIPFSREYVDSSAQSLSRVRLFVTPWTAALQASQSFTTSRSLLKLKSIASVMPSNRLILCGSLLLLPSIFPSIRVLFSESTLHIRWPKYWSFSFSIIHSVNVQD